MVADLGGAVVLDRTRVDVAGVGIRPLGTMCLEVLEGCAVEFDEGLLDDRFHLTVTLLHIHHHGDRHTTGEPLGCRFGEVADERHITRLASRDEVGSVDTDIPPARKTP